MCYGQFLGGNACGHATASIINSACAITTLSNFTGGNADGQATASIINSACAITTLSNFTGGNADGHATNLLTNSACTITPLSNFTGGIADGHATTLLTNSVCTITPLSNFVGGISDGYSENRFTNLACDLTPLPIELLFFRARCTNGNRNKKVTITWTTGTETNNSYFTIEQSTDGITYKIIGTVNGAGNSNQTLYYSFVDTEPVTGSVSYYRLKQTDFNGTYQYSPVVQVTCIEDKNAQSEIFIYPNPNNGHFIIEGAAADDNLFITDLLGREILNKKIPSIKTEVDVSHLADGLYFIRIKSEKVNITEKLVIAR